MNKKYAQPKIKAVILTSEQAILQVCQVGGGYFSSPIGVQCFKSGTETECQMAPARATRGICSLTPTENAQPS
ncbi:MAG: hypothetical protein PHQ52_08065 [Candidatus Omnitrophica bacterium]|nr:hypothetical protein [Candidatus Omnitrophota bacterium]